MTNFQLYRRMEDLSREYVSPTGYIHPTRFVVTKADYIRGIAYLELAIAIKESDPELAEQLFWAAIWGRVLPEENKGV